MKTHRMICCFTAALALSALFLLGGCSSTSGPGVRMDPNPEMSGMGQTSDQMKNEESRSLNADWRQLRDDWDDFWLVNEPSRMSRWPVP